MAERYRRFSISDRLEHVAQLVSFTMLAVTGIPQRYAGAWLSRRIIDLFGGIESVRVVHRVFATILMVAVVYHIGAIGYRKYVQRRPREMLPSMADLRAAQHSVRYLAGREAKPPKQGRFTWEEKLEYYALVWGTLVMVVSGFLLWNPIATAKVLPGEFIPAAKVFHSGEALLAVLAVIVWHMYHVHVRSFNTSMFTGTMSRKDMEHEHGLELEQIEAGQAFTPPTGKAASRRTRIYIPAAAGAALIMMAGIWVFVTFEDTAIATIDPPEQVEVFAPVETTGTLVAPTTTTPVAATTTTIPAVGWEDGLQAVFRNNRCTDCHGKAMALGGLNLATYEGTLGAVVAGDPDGSALVQVMEGGDHAVVLTDEEIASIRAWITAGAPATAGEGSAGGPPGWQSPVSGLLASCAACHGGGSPAAGLDLTTYESALAAVTAGDPEASPLYAVQAAGGHPGQLDDAALAVLREWIANGAPEAGG
ncbi:MAG: hypothetical protein KQH83_02370 [Actinobacteria bacterium]|nr:hypothetical protein [Actinomycetota bacterium]